MPASYTGAHQIPAGANLTNWALASAAAVRAKIHQMIIGSDATPADIATEFAVLRFTTAGITPATTPGARPTDPISSAAACLLTGGTYATEPVYEAVATLGLMQIALNQRATMIWNANPDKELVTVLGTANGIGLRSIASGGTPNVNTTVGWTE